MKFRDIDSLGAKPSRFILEDETFAIVGAALEVYHKLGNGFLEAVYQEALKIEFGLRGIPFGSQKILTINYKGHDLEKKYVADLLCYGQVIVEIKAINQLSPVDWSQVINYLKATNIRVGLLFNFGSVARMEQKRLIV